MSIVASAPRPVRATPPAKLSWQDELRGAVRSAAELCRRLELPDDAVAGTGPGERQFPVFATESYLRRIRPGDPTDPLLRQILPAAAEPDSLATGLSDPVGDAAARIAPGLLHKYHGRALLITSGVCAIHCRYCFRRHFAYDAEPRSLDEWRPALAAIAADASLHEVVFSGGDPLMLVDQQLRQLFAAAADIPHVRRLRLHTRLPIVLPSRVTPELLAVLTSPPQPVWLVLHANHPRELDDTVAEACRALAQHGVTLLNQSVLLRGVNDDADVLVELSERLLDLRVVPYYLHQLDRVQGALHFEAPVERGRELIAQMRARLPGFAVPRYVRESPGAPHKLVLA